MVVWDETSKLGFDNHSHKKFKDSVNALIEFLGTHPIYEDEKFLIKYYSDEWNEIMIKVLQNNKPFIKIERELYIVYNFETVGYVITRLITNIQFAINDIYNANNKPYVLK